MFYILISIPLQFLVFYLLGDLMTKILNCAVGLIQKVLIGLSAGIFITQLISLFFPINLSVLLILLLGLLVYLIFYAKTISLELGFLFIKNKILFLLAMPLLYISFLLAQEPPLNYDTNLYHFQAIKWMSSYPTIKGLANLFGPQGYNNSIFGIYSLFSLKEITGQEIFAFNWFLFSLTLLFLIKKMIGYFDFEKTDIKKAIITTVLMVLLLLFLENIASPTPDFTANILTLIILSYFILSNDRSVALYLFTLVLSTTMVTIKLSTLPLTILGVFALWKIYSTDKKVFYRALLYSVGIIFIWFTRNVLLSGWLVYPIHQVDLFSLKWKVPYNNIFWDANAIKGWSRVPGIDIRVTSQMHISEWFPLWWNRINMGKTYFLLAVISSLISLISVLIKCKQIKIEKKIYFIAIISSFLFWFFMAPEFRFNLSILFFTALLPLYIIDFEWIVNCKYQTIPLILILTLTCILFLNKKSVIMNNIIVDRMSGRWKLPKTLDYVGRPPKDSFVLNNVFFYFPKRIQQKYEDRCYDWCLPCIPSRDTGIGFIGSNIEDGFYRKSN